MKPYAAICGITQEEMLEQMHEYIERLAVAQEMTEEETLRKLKEKYDGAIISLGLRLIFITRSAY